LKVAAVVPVKALDAAKSRLSPVLSDQERGRLALWLLDHVLAAIRASGAVWRVAVVSPDEAALERARGQDAAALRQVAGDLGTAVEQGRAWALAAGADALLVVLGDLPLLAGSDVRAMIALADAKGRRATGDNSNGLVVLAPDRRDMGTNAVLLRPPEGMPLAFGEESFARHLALAREHALAVHLYRKLGTAYDVDQPVDLAELRALGVRLPTDPRCAARSAEGRDEGRLRYG
jgi:2-phospho-L-lactate/phosphoenolpyruvate guanylyltransferase